MKGLYVIQRGYVRNMEVLYGYKEAMPETCCYISLCNKMKPTALLQIVAHFQVLQRHFS